eukprot:gene38786-47168_t
MEKQNSCQSIQQRHRHSLCLSARMGTEETVTGRVRNRRTDVSVSLYKSARYWGMEQALREFLQNIGDAALKVCKSAGGILPVWASEPTPSGARLLLNGAYAGEWFVHHVQDAHNESKREGRLYFYNRGSALVIDAFFLYSNKQGGSPLLAGGHGTGLKHALSTLFSSGQVSDVQAFTWEPSAESDTHFR